MVGFLIANDDSFFPPAAPEETYLVEAASCDGYSVSRRTVRKFLNDKIFHEDKESCIVLEGVIYNKRALCAGNWTDCVKNGFLESTSATLNAWRGSFSGGFYSKATRTWTIFTSQTGYGMVYYYQKDGLFVASSDYAAVVDCLKKNHHPVLADETAAYDVLNFGFMTSDHTLINDIKRLEAGHYLTWDGHDLTVSQYHAFSITNTNHHLSEDEMIEELDRLFRNAVRLEFEKDAEYGYRHMATISGGLDSRLTVWVAAEMGYAPNMTLMEFGAADYLDEQIAKKIAKCWNTELMVKPFDDARFMLDFNKNIEDNNGLSVYPGTAHCMSMYRLINFSDFGLMHTGEEQLFWSSFDHNEDQYIDTKEHRLSVAYSTLLNDKYTVLGRLFPHTWEFFMYSRGYLGNQNCINALSKYIAHACPFQDVDFATFVFSLPLSCWDQDALYKKWYAKKYPKACAIPVERYYGAPIDATPFSIRLHYAKHIGLKETTKILLKKYLGIDLKPASFSKKQMNPLDFWYHEYKYISEGMNTFAEGVIKDLEQQHLLSPSFIGDLKMLYSQPRIMDKSIAITVLSAYAHYL